jgi:hypothetical protein
MNTTFRGKIYTRWCCIDRLSRQGLSEPRISPAGPAFPEGDSRDITPRESGLHANQACASGAWAYTEGAGQKPSAEIVGEPLATSAEQVERWFLQGDTDARRLDK